MTIAEIRLIFAQKNVQHEKNYFLSHGFLKLSQPV